MAKKISLTGIKPTGSPHLGNYLGAIRPGIDMAKSGQYFCYYFIADYHALNAHPKPSELKKSILEVAATWMALSKDCPDICIYCQSAVPEVFDLAALMYNFTSKGLLNRAHSYKAKVQANEEAKKDADWGVNMGLFNYPVLMAADILAPCADVVPVGHDQKQHLEMTRDIAQCFNSTYKRELLKLPADLICEHVGIIPGLDGRKMSKSYNNTIPLWASEKKLQKAINKIVSDSTGPDEPKDPKTSTVFNLYSFFAEASEIEGLKNDFKKGISWGEAKKVLFEKVNQHLQGPRIIYEDLINNPAKIEKALKQGAKKVRPKAQALIEKLRFEVGVL